MKTKLEKSIIELRKKGLSYKKIQLQLGCSKSIISDYVLKNNLYTQGAAKLKVDDVLLGKIIELKGGGLSAVAIAPIVKLHPATVRKYVSFKRIKSPITRRAQNSINVISWRRRKKVMLIEYKGGKCEICGYNNCVEALQFHHIDPKEKEFAISGKSTCFEKMKKEADKCVLLCANCHVEVHVGKIKLPDTINSSLK